MSFLASLSHEDLLRLREAARKVLMRHMPAHQCTDRECDKLVEAHGPQAAEALIRRAVDHGLVEGKRTVT